MQEGGRCKRKVEVFQMVEVLKVGARRGRGVGGNQVNKGFRGVGGVKSIKDSCKREVDARGR